MKTWVDFGVKKLSNGCIVLPWCLFPAKFSQLSTGCWRRQHWFQALLTCLGWKARMREQQEPGERGSADLLLLCLESLFIVLPCCPMKNPVIISCWYRVKSSLHQDLQGLIWPGSSFALQHVSLQDRLFLPLFILFVHVFTLTRSYSAILLARLSITVIIYFHSQVALALASDSPFQLASLSLGTAPVTRGTSPCLVAQVFPGSLCTFPVFHYC